MKSKDIALLAYLTHFGLLGAYLLNRKEKSDFARFHIKNMFGICVFHFTGTLIGYIQLESIQTQVELVHTTIFFISVLMWIISFIRVLLKQKGGVPFLDKY